MFDKKITELDAAGDVESTDLLEVVQDVSTSPTNNKLTIAALKSYIQTAFDSVFLKLTGGYISGTLGIGNISAQRTLDVLGTCVVGVDLQAGDSTNYSNVYSGNRQPNQGAILLQYRNAAASASPLGIINFQPRNNANTSNIAPAYIEFKKIAGADTASINMANAAGRVFLHESGDVGIGTTSPTAKLDVNSDVMRLRTSKTPASAGASGNVGDIAWDSNYIYICVASNTWKRSPIVTW